jgi:hypothetical protein
MYPKYSTICQVSTIREIVISIKFFETGLIKEYGSVFFKLRARCNWKETKKPRSFLLGFLI